MTKTLVPRLKLPGAAADKTKAKHDVLESDLSQLADSLMEPYNMQYDATKAD